MHSRDKNTINIVMVDMGIDPDVAEVESLSLGQKAGVDNLKINEKNVPVHGAESGSPRTRGWPSGIDTRIWA